MLFKEFDNMWLEGASNMRIEKISSRPIDAKKRKKIKLTIEKKNFGPIASGNMILKPLTLLVGPNNSGKSYAAMLVHSLFESLTPDIPVSIIEHFPKHFNIRILHKDFSELWSKIDSMKEGEELEIPLEKVINKIFEEIYNKRLSNEVIRSYACPLEELVRVGKESFSLKITYNSYEIHLIYQKGKLEIKWYSRLDIKLKVKVLDQRDLRVEISKDDETFVTVERWYIGENREYMFLQLIKWISSLCLANIFKSMATPCYYLPAARSGILHGHKALAAIIVKKAPFVGIEKLEIPKFSGVVSDLISSIITLPEEKGPFYSLAQEFERELLKGEIVVKTLDEYFYPEIRYNFQGTEIPLHRASSTVSELAPLTLYLKYMVELGSILIIEEPEAHLHPGNQRILAKFLVKLIRKGVNIIITTHSDYLIEQLSSFILLSQVSPEKRVSKYGYTEEDFLNPDEVAAYVFNYDKQSDGYKISEIEITEEDGISQKEHMRIIEALYEETLKLRKDVTSET